jgi:hypothetical protein
VAAPTTEKVVVARVRLDALVRFDSVTARKTWQGRVVVVSPWGWFVVVDDHGKKHIGHPAEITEAIAPPRTEGEIQMRATLDKYAADVVAGKTTLEKATGDAARDTKRPRVQVHEALKIRVDALRDASRPPVAKAAPKPVVKAAPKASGHRKEHADGSAFKALLDELGLSNKEAAAALKGAGLGGSTTYVYIATHSGSSVELLARWDAALRKYRKATPKGD